MQLTSKEVMLAIAFALLGFALSSRQWILFLDSLNPLQGLIVYYVIIFTSIFVLSRMDLVVLGFKIRGVKQTLGLTLITFAFFIIVDWESPYIQAVTGRSVEAVSPVYFQCEDGAVWYAWSQLLPMAPVETLRLLTYVFTPLLLALLGGFLVSEKVKLGW
ncbi:MAG: hypothetical protein QXU45_09120 [Candidatus Bathyarchaeia archaeon]